MSANRPTTGEIVLELMQAREAVGMKTLTADVLVQEASDPEHPLHNRFEWDNSVAGHEFRVWKARTLLSSVRVKIETREIGASGAVTVRTVPPIISPTEGRSRGGGYRLTGNMSSSGVWELSDTGKSDLIHDALVYLRRGLHRYDGPLRATGHNHAAAMLKNIVDELEAEP